MQVIIFKANLPVPFAFRCRPFFTEMIIIYISVKYLFYIQLSQLMVKLALALSILIIGSEIITIQDGNVDSICDFSFNRLVRMFSDVFIIVSLVDTCKMT